MCEYTLDKCVFKGLTVKKKSVIKHSVIFHLLYLKNGFP